AADGAWRDQRGGAEEVPDRELDLVVGELALGGVRRLEVDEVVAALLEDHHGGAPRGQDVGHGGPAGSPPHAARAHLRPPQAPRAWSWVQPRGWLSPSKGMLRQPTRSRLPPYTGSP